MRTGLDGTGQHFSSPLEKKDKKTKRGGGHWGLCALMITVQTKFYKTHSHRNFKMAGWALPGQVREKPDLFRGKTLRSFALRLGGSMLTSENSRLCFGLAGLGSLGTAGPPGTHSGHTAAF